MKPTDKIDEFLVSLTEEERKDLENRLPHHLTDKQLVDIHNCLSVLKEHGNWDYNPYMHGYYNGIELVKSIVENREPQFKELPETGYIKKPIIEFDCVITNGYVDRDTIYHMVDEGWTFVATLPAKTVHPHSFDTDKATIFVKYNEPAITEDLTEQATPKMKTEEREVKVGQTIMLADGSIDYVEDFDGSFYFLRDSDEAILHHSIVNVVVDSE